MVSEIQQLKQQALKEIEGVKDASFLEAIWRKFLGRKDGALTRILRGIKDLPEEERPKIGILANKAKEEIETKIKEKKIQVTNYKSQVTRIFDPSLPGKKQEFGHLHPLTQMRYRVADIFSSMGFEILEGPEVETDYYNFEALNIPKGHPARDMWDTFWLRQNEIKNLSQRLTPTAVGEKSKIKNRTGLLLRTHTSPVQIRVMEKRKPPLRVCVIGKCFRHEATDPSHEHTLYQIEGFAVDKKITVANLIYTLRSFLEALFEQEVEIRLRPSYFPFTEPSYEVDMRCLTCGGKGCPACSRTGWVELLGSGMIHPKVYEAVGYPKAIYTGFAFGIGLDRLAMMRYRIDDIRWFHSGDLRFIRQF